MNFTTIVITIMIFFSLATASDTTVQYLRTSPETTVVSEARNDDSPLPLPLPLTTTLPKTTAELTGCAAFDAGEGSSYIIMMGGRENGMANMVLFRSMDCDWDAYLRISWIAGGIGLGLFVVVVIVILVCYLFQCI
jgi:hypothetical protein